MKTINYFFLFAIFSFINIYTYTVFADGEMKGGNHHNKIEATYPYPTISIEVTKDAKSGYNLTIFTTNYKFTPLNVNKDNIDNEGHSHIYINGKKTRHYSPYFHISDVVLKKGKNNIRVTLNANDHSEYVVNDNILEANIVITK